MREGIAALVKLLSAVSAIIVAIIFSMVMKTVVIKRQKELRILKAAAVKSGQLARQIGISFFPSTVVG